MLAEPHAGHLIAALPPAAACGGARWACVRPTERPTTGEVARPVPQDSTTHRVVLIVEVDEPTDLSTADLVAMADVLREAAAELAPDGTTRASVELSVVDSAPPSPRAPSDVGAPPAGS